MAVRWLAGGATLSTLIACPVLAQDSPGLAPSAPWTLDYADDSCALRRVFGEGDNRAYLEFRRFAPGPALQTTVASSRMTARNPANVRYRFGGNGEWRDASALALNMTGDFKNGVLFNPTVLSTSEYEAISVALDAGAEWRPIEQAAGARATTLSLRGAFSRNLTLQLGPLDLPITVLNDCIAELMTHWGIDLEAHKSLTRRAKPIDMREASRMISYPPKMSARSMPGLVNIRLAIDETGKVTGCHIQMPLSDPEFEESSCADIQHAFEFEPALDKDGKPIASYWITRVHFSP